MVNLKFLERFSGNKKPTILEELGLPVVTPQEVQESVKNYNLISNNLKRLNSEIKYKEMAIKQAEETKTKDSERKTLNDKIKNFK